MPSHPPEGNAPPNQGGRDTAAELHSMLAAGAQHHLAGRAGEAERMYREVLRRDPRNAEALNLLGVLEGQAGRAEAAIDLIGQAVALDGENPEYRYNLGLARQATGDRAGAIASYRRAVELRPEYGDAWSNLGNLLLHKGEAEEAERCHREAVKASPQSALAHNNLGAALMLRQLPEDAAASFRQALQLEPNYAEACNGLGLALSATGHFEEAAESFGRALALRPDYLEAHNNLGHVLFEQDRLDEAEEHLRKALEVRPDYVQARLNLATVLDQKDQLDAALEIYEAILAANPGHTVALAGKAEMLDRLGRREEARRIVQPFADGGALPDAMIALYGRLALSGDDAAAAATVLEGMKDRPDMPEHSRRAVHFALGHLYDSLGSFDRAFEHFARGNALRPTAYDPGETTATVERIIAYFTPERLKSLPRAREAADLPVFIVGMPRSGTSLVEQVLSCHPEVHAAGELRDLGRIAKSLGFVFGGADGKGPADVDPQAVEAASRQHLEKLRALDPTAGRVTDKMPYNFQHLGLISALFPGARVIHCRRDAMDTCLSCYFQNFATGNFHAFDLRHVGAYYRDYERLMDHWRSVLDLPMLELCYEDHVADPEGTCRRMLEFLDLAWDARCLAFHESGRLTRTASRDQVRRPIYDSSVRRWHNYAELIGPLRDVLGATGAPGSERAAD